MKSVIISGLMFIFSMIFTFMLISIFFFQMIDAFDACDGLHPKANKLKCVLTYKRDITPALKVPASNDGD